MARLKAKKRKPHPKPTEGMYDTDLIRDFVRMAGSMKRAGDITGLNPVTLKSATMGSNICIATFWQIADAIGVSGCELLGRRGAKQPS